MSFDPTCSPIIFGYKFRTSNDLTMGSKPYSGASNVNIIMQAQNVGYDAAIKAQQDMDCHEADWADKEGSCSINWTNDPGLNIFNVSINQQEFQFRK
jgi:hypothetical protein